MGTGVSTDNLPLLSSTGTTVLDARLNGKEINGVNDACHVDEPDELITEYYHVRPWLRHAFVVCRTMHYKTFKCHLIGGSELLSIQLEETHWIPKGFSVVNIQNQPKTMSNFVAHVKTLRRIFGSYTLGSNDCRHFSDAVVKYLDL